MSNNLKDNIWLWGQTAGGHHKGYALPGENKMGPEEGLNFFGIKNLCRVKLAFETDQSFLDEKSLGKNAEKICLSLIGAGGGAEAIAKNDMADILNLAQKDNRIVAAVMDDFVSEERLKAYTPDVLAELRNKLHTTLHRKLELWSVIYEIDFKHPIKSRAKEFDVTTFWTWKAENLNNIKENFKYIKDLTDGSRLMMGAYMFDYGNQKLMPDYQMEMQLDFIAEKYALGEIEGMVLCSNCIADLGLSAVDVTKNWINKL